MDIRVKRTRTDPGFDFAYTDPKKDFDVSASMENGGAVEIGISKVGEEEGCLVYNAVIHMHAHYMTTYRVGGMQKKLACSPHVLLTPPRPPPPPSFADLLQDIQAALPSAWWEDWPVCGCGKQLWLVCGPGRSYGMQVGAGCVGGQGDRLQVGVGGRAQGLVCCPGWSYGMQVGVGCRAAWCVCVCGGGSGAGRGGGGGRGFELLSHGLCVFMPVCARACLVMGAYKAAG